MLFSVAAACALTDTQTPAPEDAVTEYGMSSADADGDATDDGETTGYVRPAKASDSDSASTDDALTSEDVRPVEPDSDSTSTDDGLTSEYVWLGAFDSADAYADDGETTGYVRPAKTSGSGAVSTGDSGDTTAPVVRPGDSDSGASASTGDSGASTGDSGDTTAPVVRPGNSGSGAASTVDDGSTTGYVRPAKTSNSGRTSADSGETVANPARPADSGQTSAPPADSDEALYAPERPPASDSGQTTAPAQPSNSGQTPAVRPSNDDGETTGYVRPVAGKNSNSGKNTDSGDTTPTSPTVPENPENMLPVNTPTTPRENPENQLPSNTPATPVTPATPAAPVNPSYGTLPNKSPYQMTISDVYTPGRTTGQYITYQGSRIPIYAGVQTRNVYSGDFVWRTGHRLRYLGSRYNAQFGVDVSAYQNRDRANGTINWAAAKADGVQFAMIRVGLRGTSTGALREDAYYARNIDGAMAQGIQTGAYIFSQATTIAEAIEEADFVIARLRGHKINGPVSIDWEMKDRSYRVYGTSKEMATACAVAFCKRVAAAGYTPMVYNSRYVAYIKYDQGALAPYMMWYPQYSPTSDTYPYPNLYYQMDYWQFTDSAVVEGIGTKIDANIWFKPKG